MLPQAVPDPMTLDGSKEARANEEAETLLASSIMEKAVKTPQPEPAVHQTQTTMIEAVIQAQHPSISGPDMSSQEVTSSATISITTSQHDDIASIAEDLVESSNQESLLSDACLPHDTKDSAGPDFETTCKGVNISTFAVEDPHTEEILRANDDSKLPHVFTLEIHASAASHTPTSKY